MIDPYFALNSLSLNDVTVGLYGQAIVFLWKVTMLLSVSVQAPDTLVNFFNLFAAFAVSEDPWNVRFIGTVEGNEFKGVGRLVLVMETFKQV